MNGLLADNSALRITRDQLSQIPTPQGTESWKPIAHIEVVQAIVESLSYRHISVVKDEYAVSHDGMKFFGVIELETVSTGVRFLLGVRNANDKSMRLAMTVGFRVLICSNLAFYGDFTPVLAKHSKHFNLKDSLAVGIDQMQRSFKPMADQIDQWQESRITDEEARLIIYRAFIEDTLDAPKHLARKVHEFYFDPMMQEFAPRTKWSLHNGFTSAFKQLEPIPQYKATASLATLFNRV
jgi:hypothetical protein